MFGDIKPIGRESFKMLEYLLAHEAVKASIMNGYAINLEVSS